MNISEVKNLVEGASYEGKVEILETICQYAGDCLENGYLGSSVANISYDEFGRVEFQSEHLSEEGITKSSGAVLDNSVIIMQVQESHDNRLLNLYSWKCDGTGYTYLAFDSKAALEKAYMGIKKANMGFLAENLDSNLQELGITYRDIMNVRVAVKVNQVQSQEEQLNESTQVEMLTSFVS